MSAFHEVLAREVARMQASHPERADEISRAHALIAMGYVVDRGDGTATVLSSDGHTHYTVNGSCDCQAAAHGQKCKHASAVALYRHIGKKLLPEAKTAQTVPAPPLPEAPVSMTAKVVVRGYEVLLTIRGHDMGAVMDQLQAALGRKDVQPPPKPAPRGNWRK